MNDDLNHISYKTKYIQSNLHYTYNEGIFLDEKNKRFVNMNNLDVITTLNYSNQFSNYRPDFYGQRAILYDKGEVRFGHMFLRHMYFMRMFEIARCKLIFPHNYRNYFIPLLEHHVKSGNLDGHSFEDRVYYWDDASKIANYMDYVTRRINKYGLHWGIINKKKFENYKEKIQKEEDELVDYFLYEMRKAPVKEQELPNMPL